MKKLAVLLTTLFIPARKNPAPSRFPIQEPTADDIRALRNSRECSLKEAKTVLHKQALAKSYQSIMKNGSQSEKIDWLMAQVPEILDLEINDQTKTNQQSTDRID